jgi:hypothetical protein
MFVFFMCSLGLLVKKEKARSLRIKIQLTNLVNCRRFWLFFQSLKMKKRKANDRVFHVFSGIALKKRKKESTQAAYHRWRLEDSRGFQGPGISDFRGPGFTESMSRRGSVFFWVVLLVGRHGRMWVMIHVFFNAFRQDIDPLQALLLIPGGSGLLHVRFRF